MKYIYPDYYKDFHCIAEKCNHSCCKGWEIDVDDETAQRYLSVGGELGEKLRKNISLKPVPHFVLDDRERCPFLKENGLCELILELGEDSLCEICAEHPRFYNEASSRVEYGIGMCCEEAERLLVSGKEPVRLICEDDGAGEEEGLMELISERDDILSVLNGPGAFKSRAEKMLSLVGEKLFDFSPSQVASFYLTLDRMDGRWTALLNDMQKYPSAPGLYEKLDDIRYTRIAHYFIFRYFISANNMKERAKLLIFALLSTMTICFLDSLGYSEEALRLYSAEIEYSEESIGLITDAADSGKLIYYESCASIAKLE